MYPGLDLDIVVARFLGWDDVKAYIPFGGSGPATMVKGIPPNERPSPYTGHRQHYNVPEYSEDIKAAWQIVDKLGAKFTGVSRQNDKWIACAEGNESISTEGSTPAHAICLLALNQELNPSN